MANGLSDILSVYRQGLASERQSRQAEMQLALQAMQFESAQRFREEGRQREDIMGVLDYTKKSAEQAKSLDAGEIYSRISSLEPIMSADSDAETGAITNSDSVINALSKPLNKRGKYGFSPAQATQIVTIANLYQMSGKNVKLISTAERTAETFAKQVARDYEQYPNSKLMKAMGKSGLIYSGLDPLQKEISADTYLGVRDALIALQNIDKEQTEIASGDYKVDTPITVADVSESDVGQMDWDSLVEKGMVQVPTSESEPIPNVVAQIDLGYLDDTTNEDILESLSFLEEGDISKVKTKLESLSSQISKKKENLNSKIYQRDELIANVDDAKLKVKDLSKKIRYHHNQGNTTEVRKLMEEQQKQKRIITSGKSGDEFKARELAKWGGGGIHGYYPDSLTSEIVTLSAEIGNLNRKRAKLGG